ncbi:GATOR complex protein WDR59 isoform X2 [Cimex lectularius]|uniref:RWD domain-containing protein n=1 Tax=Cimex lectularius TaxID=79782 RepID=A0A8I6SBA5_CIMLE|nr:GATOR complex protein WDR59 isoform X2 [Cimex lectularius]
MTTRWSSEYIVAEHRDLQASAMAVDYSGVYVLLAGRRYLAIKNLIDSNDSLRKFPRQSKYDVGAAEWSPHLQHKHLCAVSTNKNIEILCWAEGNLTTQSTLQAHTRVVNHLNWNQLDPNLLASCSIDTFTYIWDVRDTRRPSLSLSTIAGANQVRWNRQSPFLLATAHNGDVKLWDRRKGTTPVQYISAHHANIYCLDWNPNQENQLATSSQDCTVKFFDITNPRRAENVITAAAPIWRARYTPFGIGILMVIVPQIRRGENSLLLWSLSNQSSLVHTFVGHTDVVLEFEWRKHPDSLDYQLITWSKDQTLRIWQIEPFLQKLCGIDNGNSPAIESHANDGLLPPSQIGGVVESMVVVDGRTHSLELTENMMSESEQPPPVQTSQPKTLHQEFSLVNINIRNVTFDCMDPIKRRCTVTAAINSNVAVVHITFPPGYPHNIAPAFQFTTASTIDSTLKNKLLKVLKQTAQQRVKKNRSCLEPCIRQLITTLEEVNDQDKAQYLQMQGALLHSPIYSFRDAYIPFPRTSGAKFCNVGMLVCFGRSFSRRQNVRADKSTPRSLSALNTYSESPLSVPSYFYHDRVSARGRLSRNMARGVSQKGYKTTVIIYDASGLFPMSKDLAEKYMLDNRDIVGTCQHNAMVAGSFGRKDLTQVWNLASLAATPSSFDEDEDFPWETHPLSIGMIQSLISHYVVESDIQTAAMLCCVFSNKMEAQEMTQIRTVNKTDNANAISSSYQMIHQVDSSVESWNLPAVSKQNISNSCTEDDFSIVCGADDIIVHTPLGVTETVKPINLSRVSLSESPEYEQYKKAYAEILHRWCLLDARAQVMKYLKCDLDVHRGLELVAQCLNCKVLTRDAYCTTCKNPALQCIICHTSVRGGANVCLICGHGGHTRHLMEWFSENTVCPGGCGCHCLQETASALDN